MLSSLNKRWREANALRVRDVADCDTFFFYGSLMERFSNFNRYIKKRVNTIRIGYCRGYLYNLPLGFPGLIVPEDPCSTLVAGELMTFDDPLKVIKVLDRLEDYFPTREHRSIYLRRKMSLICEDPAQPGQLSKVDAWVYTYPESHLSNQHHREVRIQCGQWKAFNGPARPESELDQMYERLSYCDVNQKVMIDPLLREEALLQEVLTHHPCHEFCENRDQCGWSKRGIS
nr:gamma-glutamylcyclotransferase family protein [uncultured Desulfuromonas sp.]